MKTLFEIDSKFPDKTCLNCKNRQRHQKGGSIILYCGVRKSNRTENGLLKIKAKNPACEQFEHLNNMNTILQKLRSVELCMSAHPHNEPDSEFADRISDIQEIKIEIQQLINWKAEALEVIRNIGLQKVGELIDVPLGSNISREIIPSIEKLIKENRDLKKIISN